MKLRAILLILIFQLFCLGCVTRAIQTEAVLATPGRFPDFVEIQNLEFIDQTAGHCGPAALTMAMHWAGLSVSVEDIARQVYTPGLHGSLQSDLIGASRRQGLMAIPIRDLASVLTEVTAKHPVIVFQNLGLSWAPTWHYALIVGFDLNRKEMILHTGHDSYSHWSMKKFERSWQLGDYWGLVVLPAGELAASADERSHVTAAVGLELATQDNQAEKSYRKILQKWPTSLIALIGLANLSYKKGNRAEARALLQTAIKVHPESLAAQHNLAIANHQSAAND